MNQENKDNIDLKHGALLESITDPSQLRKLDVSQLPQLCEEIRDTLISGLSKNPGHFGSSMGAVKIIVALHYIFNTPYDRIVFDVGHQAYAHKLLTGRQKEFPNQRTLGGISGFPNPMESEYDTFMCGHASNSISAALGMAIADMNTPGNEDRKTVALIGDASISGGLAFEGLNNASINPNNLLIVLNDNDMSIDDNVGALHRYLSDITTSSRYNRVRYKIYKAFKNRGLINEKKRGSVLRFGNALKSLISRQQNIFEGLNIRYFGPFDGNDVEKVVKVLSEIKDMKGPRILHLHTVKGRGFKAAEENPSQWHAPGKFNPSTGKKLLKSGGKAWQNIFGEHITQLARKDERIVGITAAMPSGTSIDILQKEFPERVYDVGISEGHSITFAGGLAAAGKRPFVAIYSSFLQRALDNIIHDVAIQGLPVTICIDRAGIVGEDGVTHHGLFDLVYLRMIPGLKIGVPSSPEMLRKMMDLSLLQSGPFAIRYPRGKCESMDEFIELENLSIGKGITVRENKEARVSILTVGPTLTDAIKAADALQKKGKEVNIYDMIWVKPLDQTLLDHITANSDFIITVEDGVTDGGFGSAVSEYISSRHPGMKVVRLGIPDIWIAHGTVSQLKEICGYDADAIEKAVINVLVDEDQRVNNQQK